MSTISTLQSRFLANPHRHSGISWNDVEARIIAYPEKLSILERMEETGGEPDVVGHDIDTGEYIWMDCSTESPVGRRSLCYDRRALESRKRK